MNFFSLARFSEFEIAFAPWTLRFRAAPGRHQSCRTVFASFARLNHSGPITFYAEMGMFDHVPEEFCETVFHTEVNPSTRSSRTWESRTNSTQGLCSWHSLRSPRSSSALRRRPVSSALATQHSVLLVFYYYTKLTGNRVSLFFLSKKPCSVLFFSPFSPKLGLQNLTGARIAHTLTVTLLPHSLSA